MANANTWHVGDTLINGNPLRYMEDPVAAGRSADEYSDYATNWGNCQPTSDEAQGPLITAAASVPKSVVPSWCK